MNTGFPKELQRQFEQAIVTGDYAQGQIISLSDLACELQVPVEQMLRVVDAAQRKGLVDWAGEKGATLRILGLPTSRFASVFTHTAGSGLKPRSEVRQVEIEPATRLVAAKLRIETGRPVYRYVRTRWVNQHALANQTNYMPFEICPGLEQDDVTCYSFQKLLEEKYHAVLAEMQEKYQLIPATAQDRAVLALAEGALVLIVDRIALSATGWPLVWAEIRIRPDRFEYVAALWPRAAELLKT